MSEGLLLVDIQRDYFPGGRMELVAMEAAAAKASALLERFRAQGSPVFHLRHVSLRPGADFFRPDTDGVEIHASVTPQEGEAVIEKHFPNGFRDTSLAHTVTDAGVHELVICGAMSHMCIDATVRAAFDYGFPCTVVEDACATRDIHYRGTLLPAAQVHACFMAALQTPYAKVVSAAELARAGG